MPRPAIIIGVGGTGSWVLSWLKKDLVETYGSLDDIPVRLLLLDVANIISDVGRPGADWSAQRQEEHTTESQGQYSRFIIIDQDEFIQLPTDKNINQTRRIQNAVKRQDSQVEHFTHWFRADFFPEQSLVSLSDGAGQFRQLGRLSLLQGLHFNGKEDPVYRHIRNLIEQTARPVQPGGPAVVDVHIAGSFAGGAGSGMFLDLAWLVRKVAPSEVRLFITGFFALPSVFGHNISFDMRAKAFTTWRELNRMQTIREMRNEFLIKWGEGYDRVYEVKGPAYDHVYLVDPGRKLQNAEPEKSIFPIMAEAVSFFLDSLSGHHYIQHITSNLNKRKTSPEYINRPTYSTLYVKAWKLPVFHSVNVARHRTALAYLDQLLQVERQQRPDELGNVRTVYQLAPNPFCQNRTGEIFSETLEGAGNTRFIALQQQISDIRPADRLAEVQRYAAHADGLLSFYAQMPNTPAGDRINLDIQQVTQFAVPKFGSTNNNAQLQENMLNARDLLYGRHNVGGQYAQIYGDFVQDRAKGELYDQLGEAHRFILLVFRDRVRAWLQRELNQSDEKSSGLACALSTLRQLERDLENNIQFFIDVRKALKSVESTYNQTESAYRRAYSRVQHTGLVPTLMNMVGFGAKRAVHEWLDAERRYLLVQRSHRSVQRSIATLEAMHEFVRDQVLTAAEEMERQLVTNDHPDYRGVYRSLNESLEDENERHAYDMRLGDVVELLQDDRNIPDVDWASVDALIAGTTWEVDEDMNISLNIRIPGSQNPVRLETRPGYKPQTRYLVRQLLEGVAEPIIVTGDTDSALRIKGIDGLLKELPSCVQTLYTKSETHRPLGSEIRTFYMRCQAEAQEENTIKEQVSKQPDLPQPSVDGGFMLVGSENKNKIVVFSAEELLLPQYYSEWDQCQEKYRMLVIGNSQFKIDPHYEQIQCDHLFAAEQNALELEWRFQRNGYGPLPLLSHRLVHLLEHWERLAYFFRLWALDCIQRVETGGHRMIWVINNPLDPADPDQSIPLCERDNNDMLSVMERYVVYGRPLGDTEGYIRYDHLHEDTDKALDTERWLNSPKGRKQLLNIYEYERQAAEDTSQALQEALGEKLDRPIRDIRKALDSFFEQRRKNTRSYRQTLAEELAYDLTRTKERSEDMVPEGERQTHLDAIRVVTRLFYEEFAQQVQSLIDDRDDDRTPPKSSTRRTTKRRAGEDSPSE